MLTYIPTCLPMTPYGVRSLRYGIPIGEEGENPNWRYSSTRNPNLGGLPFGSADGGSNPTNVTNDGNQPLTDAGLHCARIPESATFASGINDRDTLPSGTFGKSGAHGG